ncbi:MAG: hypothetical protein QXU98_06700 [Candidatus Parvarchaeota archaeon]
MTQKAFRTTEKDLELYEKLKNMENLKSDSDFFSKMLIYTEKFLNQKVVDIELLEEKERELKALYIKLGELQGELNIRKKSFWKRLFGG